ncbi:hypothetical protein COCCADRAFT_88306 [Bipolaris zeicola 26-R-13]|uniref:Uncharacterized protein n=1 Tax=Cochliobolus carbonum (strain 26-R-13) TaxID=930089 RepID=W6YFI8_COCC2|nr:uncharacterized protein COCCADRAFT_88306 [Bipolaris zeicola 26-R-13]EUC36418.1 hypothetical protein COCCADRAFT_88306 [Bipolaris zeicola 26-R-13]
MGRRRCGHAPEVRCLCSVSWFRRARRSEMQRPRADQRQLDQAAHDAAPERHCRDEHRVADLECGTWRLVDAGVHRPVAVRDVGASKCFSALTGSGGQWRSRGRGGRVVQLLKRSTSGGELDSRAGRTHAHTHHTQHAAKLWENGSVTRPIGPRRVRAVI